MQHHRPCACCRNAILILNHWLLQKRCKVCREYLISPPPSYGSNKCAQPKQKRAIQHNAPLMRNAGKPPPAQRIRAHYVKCHLFCRSASCLISPSRCYGSNKRGHSIPVFKNRSRCFTAHWPRLLCFVYFWVLASLPLAGSRSNRCH